MSKKEKFDELDRQITAAIYEFEEAARKLSRLEEKMARLTAPDSVGGIVARHMAVRSAILERDQSRAEELVNHYCSEKGTSEIIKQSLINLLSS